ncbi:MAG: hypothetical protein HKO98_10565, partial [Gemmatimonadetes bacterium]|nr:hypothetical protein [Gemmatimonadota bacterium]
FEAFLASVDRDDTLPGNQPYTSPGGDPILTLADSHWFGPAETWPKEVYNWPYIEFWHRLDAALAAEGLTGMGSEGIGDALWEALFTTGPLVENPALSVSITRRTTLNVRLEAADQRGTARPASAMGDVGAIEIP